MIGFMRFIKMENNSQNNLEDLVAWLEVNLRKGKYDLVDLYLLNVSVADLEPSCILAVLNFTSFERDKFKNRVLFLEQAESILKNRLGNDRAESLLKFRR